MSFENAGYWRTRGQALLGKGIGPTLTVDGPPARAITLAQFRAALNQLAIHIDKRIYLSSQRRIWLLPTLRARTAIFVLTATREAKLVLERPVEPLGEGI